MLIQTEVGRAEVVAKQLATLPGVLTAEFVTGPYDVIVRIGADTLERMEADIVPSVQQTTGITRTLTCPIASKAQPEAMAPRGRCSSPRSVSRWPPRWRCW